MPRSEQLSQVQFIEIEPGVRVAANVKVPEFLNVEQGQNFFEQPPFSWLFADPYMVPLEFLENESQDSQVEQQQEVMVALVKVAFYFHQNKFQKIETGNYAKINRGKRVGYRTTLLKHLQPHLPSNLSMSNWDQMYSTMAVIGQVEQFLAEYPHIFAYLNEYWATPQSARFDAGGAPKIDLAKGSYRPRTYASFLSVAWQLNPPGSAKLRGLYRMLPDHRALQPEEYNEFSYLYPIVAVASLVA